MRCMQRYGKLLVTFLGQKNLHIPDQSFKLLFILLFSFFKNPSCLDILMLHIIFQTLYFLCCFSLNLSNLSVSFEMTCDWT